jgi:hypothetical protein
MKRGPPAMKTKYDRKPAALFRDYDKPDCPEKGNVKISFIQS